VSVRNAPLLLLMLLLLMLLLRLLQPRYGSDSSGEEDVDMMALAYGSWAGADDAFQADVDEELAGLRFAQATAAASSSESVPSHVSEEDGESESSIALVSVACFMMFVLWSNVIFR